ncbi:MAG: cell division protein SepF [Nanoarchaeota archaeon]
MVIDRIKRVFSNALGESGEDEYLEIDLEQEGDKQSKILVKLFTLNQYEDVNVILNALRDGYTIAIVDFRVLKQKDPVELKRAVSKIKKTIDALGGSIAGHENLVVATPSFARIHKELPPPKPSKKDKYEEW